MKGIIGGDWVRFAVRKNGSDYDRLERPMNNGKMAWCRVPAGNYLMTVPLLTDTDQQRK
jgi:hypothetical protein